MSTVVRDSTEAARRLAGLTAWRWGAVASGALVCASSLAGELAPGAAGVALAVAVVLGFGAEVRRRLFLEAWVVRDDLAGVPEVTRARERLVAAEHRRQIARSLRDIAGRRRVSRHDPAPLLVDRLGPVRADLLAVAAELETAPSLDARTMAEILRLITDGARSPLLNTAVPESELAVLLRRIRFRLAAARTGDDHARPAC